MASVEAAIRNFLLTKSAVTALVGSGDSARIRPNVVEQTWRPTQGPFVTYEQISSDEEHTLADRTGFVQTRFQFTTYASTPLSANATARTIKNCGLAAMKGTYSTVKIRGVTIESGLRTDVEKPNDGTANFVHIAQFDIMVSYLEE